MESRDGSPPKFYEEDMEKWRKKFEFTIQQSKDDRTQTIKRLLLDPTRSQESQSFTRNSKIPTKRLDPITSLDFQTVDINTKGNPAEVSHD
jgi:hypothetical protein